MKTQTIRNIYLILISQSNGVTLPAQMKNNTQLATCG